MTQPIGAGARRRPAPALFVALLLAAAVAPALSWRMPGDPALHPPPEGAPVVTLYVVNNGWHSDVALPAAAVRARGGPTAEALLALPEDAWMLAGWGDARFYRESGVSPRRVLDGLRALFAPRNPSVVQLRVMPRDPAAAYGRRAARLTVSEAGFEQLLARLDAEFALEGGRPTELGPGFWPTRSRFFAGARRFGIRRLCNHFTAELLHAAGVPVRPVAATLPAGLSADVRRAEAGTAPPGEG